MDNLFNSVPGTGIDAAPAVATPANNYTDGKVKYYDGGGSIQLAAEH